MIKKSFPAAEGNLPGAKQDVPNITAGWVVLQDFIDGVILREVKNVIKVGGGKLTEIYRRDWGLDTLGIDQVFQNMLPGGGISGWHAHQYVTDRLHVSQGYANLVLYDARSNSPTYRKINEFCLGSDRPGLLIAPNRVWHAVQNLSHEHCHLLNLVDKAYDYDHPDHWRLPLDTDQIPYTFVKPVSTDPNL